MDKKLERKNGYSQKLIRFVDNRPGHDLRYAIDSSNTNELSWSPAVSFKTGLNNTVDWYLKIKIGY